jgi:hypothetical protein
LSHLSKKKIEKIHTTPKEEEEKVAFLRNLFVYVRRLYPQMAAILKLLQTVDPRTRQYIRYFKISEVYEVRYRPKNIDPRIFSILSFIAKISISNRA